MRALASTFVVGFLAAGCVAQSDPATPCAAMDLGDPEPATITAQLDAPVLAVAADPEPFVLHYVCSDNGFESCTLTQTALPELSPGRALMISSTGEWIVGFDTAEKNVLSYRVDRYSGVELESGVPYTRDAPRHLLASLRGSNIMIVRDASDEKRGRLARYEPGATTAIPIGQDQPDLFLAAVGERYIVGRKRFGAGVEELYLVGATKDVESAESVGLIRADNFSRVVLSPGDARVIATSGEGDDAETFVFSVPDGDLLDRFVGAAITGRRPLESVPGMQVVSPDGSHAVYRTPSGAIAMRNVDNQTSCMLRSSHAGTHQLAGFSASGLVYIESESAVGQSRILAFDPATRHLAALGDPERDVGKHLAALPARSHDDADPVWAVGVSDGAYHALQEDGPTSPLGLDDVIFMPRDDTGVWVTNTARDRQDGTRTLSVRRIDPQPQGTDRMLVFNKDNTVKLGDDDKPVEEQLARSLVCMSTGVPGSWGYRCGRPGEAGFLSGTNTPDSEDPNTDRLEPEVPELPDDGEE